MESLGSQRWVFSCVAYNLLNPISLETLQSMRTRWSFILWACDNLLLVKLWQNPLSQQNKDSRSVLSHRLRMREIPAPPIDDADKQLVPREAHHNLEMLECLQQKAVLIHQNISATNCGNQNVPIHSGRHRLNIKFRLIQLSKSDGYLVTIWLRLHSN